MIPNQLRTLFWDVNFDRLQPAAHPEYMIDRILEYGDEQAVAWMRQTFPEVQIKEVLRGDRRLSRRSANFWALVFHIPAGDVAALR